MTKSELIVRLVPLFRQYGYEGASLSRISQATGLGKASLYHYFPGGKEQMAEAVLDHLSAWSAEHILKPLSSESPPRERLRQMTESMQVNYDRGRQACLLAILSMGDAKDTFASRVRPALQRLIAAVARVLEEAGLKKAVARERAEDAVLQVQGALVLSRALDDPAPFQRIMKQMPENLLH